MLLRKKLDMPTQGEALPGRASPIPTATRHFVNGQPLAGPWPQGCEIAIFGMGCFWGVERVFWQLPGVHVTMVGYGQGYTPNPTYEEVCSGRTGHNELVRVVFDPAQITYMQLLKAFFENHDPTQGFRQGNDIGTQYRSGIYCIGETQQAQALRARVDYANLLAHAGFGKVTTEIAPAEPFYMAEEYHQQYLAKNPAGYCGIKGTGIACPVGLSVSS